MKKFFTILALVLVVAMCASFAVSAADVTITSVTTGSNTASQAATLTYKAVTDSEAIYSVDVAWTDLAFNYDAGGKTWSPSDHEDVVSGAEWKDAAGKLTVTNHSNNAVDVVVAFQTASNGNATIAISGENITNGAFNLTTGVGKTFATADSKLVNLTASGVPNANSKLGDIVVTITAAN